MMQPRIALVTPSYNQGQFLETTLNSVLSQGYPQLEYVVMDGGSSDNSVEIVQRYAGHLSGWVSQPDDGQYDAITEGFARISGEVMGWLNSDDMHLPWTLQVVGEIFTALPQVEWLTTRIPLTMDVRGLVVKGSMAAGFSREGFFRGENILDEHSYSTHWIMQEATFWRRDLWERAGGYVGGGYPLAGDFELWARFYNAGAQLYAVDVPLAAFRQHAAQKSADLERYQQEAYDALKTHGGYPYGRVRSWLRGRVMTRLPYRLTTPLGWRYRVPLVSYKAGRWQANLF
jgi:glycosyltransferase involved in cell wall biosynthesis